MNFLDYLKNIKVKRDRINNLYGKCDNENKDIDIDENLILKTSQQRAVY